MQEQSTAICGCGCGAPIKTHDANGNPRWFVRGHHKRSKSTRPDDDTIRQLYVIEQMGVAQIAKKYGVADSTVRAWLSGLRIRIRSRADANRIIAYQNMRYCGPDNLRELYVEQQLQPREIGAMFGVAANTVRGWLDRAGIQRRTRSEAKRLANGLNRPSPTELRRMYVDEEISSTEISRTLGVDIGTALNWLRDAGITIRSLSEAGLVRSKKRALALGTPIEKKLNAKQRYEILERDGFRCVACGRSPRLHAVVLHVDHYIPRAKGGSNLPPNLQSLCEECNLGKKDRMPREVSNAAD
jgi:transposase